MVNKEKLIRRYALTNAVEYDGKAKSKTVLSNLFGQYPRLRKNVLEIKSRVEDVVDKVNKMPLEKQKKELEELGTIKKKEKKEEDKKVLPEMVKVRVGEFVVRFAPNPNGPLHIGSARPAIINHEYAKKYRGKYILRFDDTDPINKVPEKKFYKWIQEDLKWLGIEPDKVITASKRLGTYIKYGGEVVDMGKAYVCTCEPDEWRRKKKRGDPCPCRRMSVSTHKNRWEKMKGHKFKEGEAVLRIKTDLEDKNPAVRDWAAFRIVDEPMHPLVKNKYLWPLYNFQSAIDDKLLGITHILRGQEHASNESKQKYLYNHFEWDYPVTVVLGRFSLSGKVMSTSKVRKGIKNGEYQNWEDLRLGTLRALKRRGIQSEAIKNMIMDIGAKPSDVNISMRNLAAYNRKIIDAQAHRYFFVSRPVKIKMDRAAKRKISLDLHPDKSKGKRKFRLGKTFYIDKNDFDKYKGLEIRLKDLYNIRLGKKSKFTGKELKNIPKIQWVPHKYISVRVLKPNKRMSGYAEENLKKEKVGNIVQFERFGFVKIQKKKKDNIVVIFAHK